ncbi:hypothetical protein [Nocardia sp. NPDC051832]|uniref:hypothetical protein n=1 Tax=Nocardia sp. NPDC051832 TaxID=3155673 RepID=UPI003419006B
MLVLTDPTKPDETFAQKDFLQGAKMLAGRVDPPTGSAGTLHKLLTAIVQVAIEDHDNTFTEADIAYAYQKLLRLAKARALKWEADAAACQKFLEDKDNGKHASSLLRAQKAQDSQLDKLDHADFVVFTRGTDPTQALNIMTYETFGGVWPGPARADKPSESDAGVQTGLGVKVTSKGRLEEWSLGTLDGFSTGGFMLIAVAKPSQVSLPPVKVRGSGERGVCGFADQRLLGVAILRAGPKSPTPPLERAIEGLLKQGKDNATSALREATLRR